MNILKNKNNFIQVLVDCNGISREEAEEMSKEFKNDLREWIESVGGDESAIEECKEFLKV